LPEEKARDLVAGLEFLPVATAAATSPQTPSPLL